MAQSVGSVLRVTHRLIATLEDIAVGLLKHCFLLYSIADIAGTVGFDCTRNFSHAL